ncbi:hypothetical protein HPB49_018099 [Dermacentor silvarum]|uniref:Uncharacterized protein n=1 Tax=Dermacentor silvarum TaxID=543639 RepID=A0ACB8D7K3_DERSI|nr:uncharacterized protein LOC119444601 [Dermacentor silvarum]KAH7960239.1 hypothetical protein HPB49_018099 [Dermacentor silvarum]
MKSPVICLLLIAVLHCVFVGSLLLPLGSIASTANGILGFKISLAASALSMLTKGFKGTFNLRAGTDIADSPSDELNGRSGLLVPDMTTTTSTTTEQTEVRVPISVLQDIFKLNHDQRHQTDLLFTFLKEMDDRGCVSRMVCESATDAMRLGQVGNATAHFFETNVAVNTGPASFFLSAAKTGRSKGLAGCAQAFPECTADLPHILTAAGLM